MVQQQKRQQRQEILILYCHQNQKKVLGILSCFVLFFALSHATHAQSHAQALTYKPQHNIDQVVRFWKLKKRPKQKKVLADVGENSSSSDYYPGEEDYGDERMTDEELIVKRMEMQERQRDKMPIEQRYQQQIGRLEMQMRASRKK